MMKKALPSEALYFYYGDEKISFTLNAGSNLTDKIRITVKPCGSVAVSAPLQAGNDAVLSAIKKRARWIYRQQQSFLAQNSAIAPRLYISGESHFYLGKRYLLKVVETADERQGVKLLRGRLQVSMRQKDSEKVQALLNEWYKTRAKEVFAMRLETLLVQTFWINQAPPIRLQTMQTHWGNCSPQGRLTLNPHLVKAPRECIDYVILHELCHLAEHNHSPRFYRLMAQVLPGWQSVKHRLDNMAAQILASH